MMFKCHCHDCQQVTGGGFVTGLLVPAPGFRLTKGQLRYHFIPSAAGSRLDAREIVGGAIKTSSPFLVNLVSAPLREHSMMRDLPQARRGPATRLPVCRRPLQPEQTERLLKFAA
jgi:Glutathione-dependent formaldehyde-activating enzyme